MMDSSVAANFRHYLELLVRIYAQKSLYALMGSVILSVQAPAVEAQQRPKLARIGVLISGASSTTLKTTEAFRIRLRDLGYVEGQNLRSEFRYADGKSARLPELAAELARLQVDVIAAFGAPAIRAAKNATQSIPIVFETLSDAVAMGFVPSLVRPGGNVTGVTGFASELGGKWLELLRQVVPTMRAVALLSNSTNPNSPAIVSATADAATKSGMTLKVIEARNTKTVDSGLSGLAGSSSVGLIVAPDAFFNTSRQQIANLAIKHRLPTISSMESLAGAGGLMFYGTTLVDNWRRAAGYVDRILKGAKPADLPVERPTKFEFVINLKTAKQLGLTIPPNVLARADRVVR